MISLFFCCTTKTLAMKFLKNPFFILILLTIVCLSSCKKYEQKSHPSKEGTKFDISEYVSSPTLRLLRERINKEGKSFTVSLNEKIKTYYTDETGRMISENERRSFVSACTGFTDAYVTLVEYKQNFDCNNGYVLSWKYQITTDNNIVAANSTFPAQKSKGLIRIYHSGSYTPAYSDITYDVNISDLGSDPNYGAGYESFEVEFVSDYVPESEMNNAMVASLKIGANLAIDCDNGTAPIGIALTDYTIPNNTAGDPCERNDKVWVIPSGGINGIGFTVTGVDPFGNCPVNYGYPTCQEVQYSVNGGSFQDIVNVISSSPFLGTKYLQRWDVAYPPLLSSGTYTYIFRYRNVIGVWSGSNFMTDSCVSNRPYTTEVWTITY